jgi:hypothetical protein
MVARNLFSVVACAALTTGCGWGVQPRVPAIVGVTSAPVDIEASPQVTYEGRPTYLSQGRWYYCDGIQWRAYSTEPSDLAELRLHLRAAPILRAAPARHNEPVRHSTPSHEPGTIACALAG